MHSIACRASKPLPGKGSVTESSLSNQMTTSFASRETMLSFLLPNHCWVYKPSFLLVNLTNSHMYGNPKFSDVRYRHSENKPERRHHQCEKHHSLPSELGRTVLFASDHSALQTVACSTAGGPGTSKQDSRCRSQFGPLRVYKRAYE